MTRSRIAALPLALSILALPSAAGAQEACDGPPTTAAMRSCQEARLALVEAELSAVLERLFGMVGDDAADLLRESQRTWEEHRAAHCRFVSARYEGGSLQPVLLTGCFRDVTAARVEELRRCLPTARPPPATGRSDAGPGARGRGDPGRGV